MYSMYIQSNLYIKATKGNLKICPLIAVAFIYRIKLYALFKNGKTETVLYRRYYIAGLFGIHFVTVWIRR
jgi:hypothetical protein